MKDDEDIKRVVHYFKGQDEVSALYIFEGYADNNAKGGGWCILIENCFMKTTGVANGPITLLKQGAKDMYNKSTKFVSNKRRKQ